MTKRNKFIITDEFRRQELENTTDEQFESFIKSGQCSKEEINLVRDYVDSRRLDRERRKAEIKAKVDIERTRILAKSPIWHLEFHSKLLDGELNKPFYFKVIKNFIKFDNTSYECISPDDIRYYQNLQNNSANRAPTNVRITIDPGELMKSFKNGNITLEAQKRLEVGKMLNLLSPYGSPFQQRLKLNLRLTGEKVFLRTEKACKQNRYYLWKDVKEKHKWEFTKFELSFIKFYSVLLKKDTLEVTKTKLLPIKKPLCKIPGVYELTKLHMRIRENDHNLKRTFKGFNMKIRENWEFERFYSELTSYNKLNIIRNRLRFLNVPIIRKLDYFEELKLQVCKKQLLKRTYIISRPHLDFKIVLNHLMLNNNMLNHVELIDKITFRERLVSFKFKNHVIVKEPCQIKFVNSDNFQAVGIFFDPSTRYAFWKFGIEYDLLRGFECNLFELYQAGRRVVTAAIQAVWFMTKYLHTKHLVTFLQKISKIRSGAKELYFKTYYLLVGQNYFKACELHGKVFHQKPAAVGLQYIGELNDVETKVSGWLKSGLAEAEFMSENSKYEKFQKLNKFYHVKED
jgi:hypothetical protein